MIQQEARMTDQTDLPGSDLALEDMLRVHMYDFLAALLARPPGQDLLDKTAGLGGDESDLGQAASTLARVASLTKPRAVESEFNKLFVGLGRGELLPYASYYLTGFLNEKPLALLRQDMAANAMARAQNVFEPEDNIASLMEMMGAMIAGRFGTPAGLDRQRSFFNKHIGPWATHFFTDLEAAETSVFYAPVGSVGRAFMAIETEAFRLSGT